HLLPLPHHRQQRRPGGAQGFQTLPDRLSLDGRTGPRHQRRPENHGHHHPHPDHRRNPAPGRQPTILGHLLLRPGDRTGHLTRRLAHHPNHGQTNQRDPKPPRLRRRDLQRRGHPDLRPPRLRPVHHPGLHRLHLRRRRRTTTGHSPMERRRPNGTGLADDPASRRDRRRGRSLGRRQRHRRHHHRRHRSPRHRRRHLRRQPPQRRQRPQRQRRPNPTAGDGRLNE